ncbi:hypothetical protein F4775DRAFT_566734 [Biscogniauxia sp. FL1348]|nr:hypothetical protein F4775DRAFT_566734 [Biscogniauxia sp. FL1348]
MPKVARDRIEYPSGIGFPHGNKWSRPSRDRRLRAQSYVHGILDDLGTLIDAIEGVDPLAYPHIEWTQLSGLHNFKPKAPIPGVIVDFVVDKANSISVAYSMAVRRRYFKVSTNCDLYVSDELREFNKVVKSLFHRKSAPQILEESLGTTELLQRLIDLLEQHSSKVVLSYDAMYPDNPDSTNHGHPGPRTTQSLQGTNLGPTSTSTSRPDTSSSRRSSRPLRRSARLRELLQKHRSS